MILGIMGSRGILDKEFVYKFLDQYAKLNTISEVVSGKAIGPDSLGENWALERGYKFTGFPPLKEDLEKYGKGAFFIRNCRMADYVDKAVIFWDGISNGTNHMIGELQKRDKEYSLCTYRLDKD
jgi:putative intracellular protease/amidase